MLTAGATASQQHLGGGKILLRFDGVLQCVAAGEEGTLSVHDRLGRGWQAEAGSSCPAPGEHVTSVEVSAVTRDADVHSQQRLTRAFLIVNHDCLP